MDTHEFKIKINNPKLKMQIISLEASFRKELATNKKAKDCLNAIIQLKLNGEMSHFFALRLLGQIEDGRIQKPLFQILKSEFAKNGLNLVWHERMLIVSQL